MRLPHAYRRAGQRKVYFPEQGKDFDPEAAGKMSLCKGNDLPVDEDVFVYCLFQSMHKISPEAFDTWMRILNKTSNSGTG